MRRGWGTIGAHERAVPAGPIPQGGIAHLGVRLDSGVVQWDAHVTLVAEEPFSEAARQEVALMPVVLRRNLVTRGIDLKELIGRKFRIGGEVVLRGRKAWPPCSHVVKLSGRPEIFKYLAGGTGIGADAVTGGIIRLGDRVEILG